MMRDISKLKDIPFFFILGSPRSGTSLLRFLLDSHENIYIPLETPYIVFLYRKYYKIKIWNEAVFEELYNDLSCFGQFKLWNTNKDLLKQEILSFNGILLFQDLCKIIHTSYVSAAPKGVIKIIGDKNPLNSYYTKTLYTLFPQARFVHIVRDYRAQTASVVKAGFYTGIISSVAARWKYYNNQIEKLKECIPEQFITIRYEDLVDDTEGTLKKICSFFNIEYMEIMSKHIQKEAIGEIFNKHAARLVHTSLHEGITPEKKNKWKNELSKKQIKICDCIAGNFSKKYDYIPEFNHFSFLYRLSLIPGKVWGVIYFPILKMIGRLPFSLLSKIFNRIHKRNQPVK